MTISKMTRIALSLALTAAALPALANPTLVAKCATAEGDDPTWLNLKKAGSEYSAVVTVESFGGSYPDFRFTELHTRKTSSSGPVYVEGKGFKLTIPEDRSKPVILEVPSIGVHKAELNCSWR